MKHFKAFFTNETGATAIDYGLFVGLAVAIVTALIITVGVDLLATFYEFASVM